MSNNAELINLDLCAQTKIIEKQKQVKADLGTIQADKILSVSATPYVLNKKTDTNKLLLDGYIYYNILYITTDGIMETMDYSLNYSEQIDIPGLTENSNLLVTSHLLDCVPTMSNDKSLIITSTIMHKVCVILNKNINCVDVDNCEDLCTLTSEVEISQVLDTNIHSFGIDNHIELGQNCVGIINTTANITNSEFYCTDNALIINGQIETNILYKTSDDTHPILTKVQAHDFKYEIEVDGITSNNTVFPNLSLWADKTVVEQDEENGELTIHYAISCDYIIFENKKIKTIIDAYSVNNEIDFISSNQENVALLPMEKFQEQMHTSLVLDKDYETIEKIVGCNTNNVVITKTIAEKDTLNFEGIAYANIIYVSYNQDTEQKTTESIIAELPFSYRLNINALNENDIIYANANLTELDAKAKRAQELDIFAQLKIQVFVMRKKEDNISTQIELGNPKLPDPAGLSIYLMNKGTSAWETAKQLSITLEQLEEQNPNLIFPLEDTQKVILYRQILKKA